MKTVFTYFGVLAVAMTPFVLPAAEISAPMAAGETSTQAPAPPIRIADLVASTVGENPELAYYKAEVDAAKDKRDVAGRMPDPELGVQIGQRSLRSQGGGGGDGISWSVSISQRFDFTGRNALRKAIADRQVERAEAGIEQFRLELAAKATELGHALLAAQQRMDASDEVAARGRRLLDTLILRDPAGVAPLLERRVIEAEVIKLEKRAADERAKLLTALAELNMLRGLSPDSPLKLARDKAEFIPAPDESSLFAKALRDNFTLKQYELGFEEQGLNVSLERKQGYGDVTLAPYYTEANGGDRERTVGLGISVPLPLWDRNASPSAEARARKAQAETALQVSRRELRKDLATAVQSYKSSQSLMTNRGREEVDRFREAADLADRHYRLGAVPVSTYLSLQEAYLDVVETITTTRADAARSAARLTAITGMPMQTFLREPEAKQK